jgi:type IV pilus assembly protein PilN
MAKINLLPWRAERRKLREREFYMMLGAAAVAAVLAVLLCAWWMSECLENQDSRNAYITNAIKGPGGLDEKLKEINDLEKTKSNYWRGNISSKSFKPAARRWCICSTNWLRPFPKACA